MLQRAYTRIIDTIVEHRKLLGLPGSPTGRLVGIWARIMVLPQFILAPFTLLFGVFEGPMIFVARFLAMHIVHDLDKHMPYTRALGLCHLATFGPLFVYFSLNFNSIHDAWGMFGILFAIEYAIIGLCLYLDARDMVLHMMGQPYPCYVRDHQRLGNLKLDDSRANEPVTLFSRLFW